MLSRINTCIFFEQILLPSRSGIVPYNKIQAYSMRILPIRFLIILYLQAIIISMIYGQMNIYDLTITVEEESREIGYTNKRAGHYYTLTHNHHTSGWMGWMVSDRKLMDDYEVIVNGISLLRTRAEARAFVKPHQLTRRYPDGIEETFTLLDDINAIIVDIMVPGEVAEPVFRPRFTDSFDEDDYITEERDGIILLGRSSSLSDTNIPDFPQWLAITAIPSFTWKKCRRLPPQPGDIIDTGSFAPVELAIQPGQRSFFYRFIVVAGYTVDETVTLAGDVAGNAGRLIEERKERMQALLHSSYIKTADEKFNKALAWTRISMDALVMNQTGHGIYAGLPWFNNYWGRDTFISFPGAVLVSGEYSTAREILKSFAEFQDDDPASPTFGRVPNRVTTQSVIYNTTDGTPWFVRELYEYYKYTADSTLIRELYPVVRRSIEGALKNFTDDYFFLTHADADTWMDAVGPDGPWSPRGNRAVDIQYLWYRQLTDGAAMAVMNGDEEQDRRWRESAEILKENFNRMFVGKTKGILFDHLKSDGTPDTKVRPNQIFAFDLVEDEEVRRQMLRSVLGELTYPWGVASLSLDDTNFHPYHHYAPYYVQDAAYHNGIVWTWLIGRVIEAAVQYNLQDVVYEVTDNMVHQILERGSVGTFSELLDAFPRNGETEPRLSGTFTQAWNLAEFLRSAYQDYLGLRPDVPDRTLHLKPALPAAFGTTEALIPFGNERLYLFFDNNEENATLKIGPSDLRQSITLSFLWGPRNTEPHLVSAVIVPGDTVIITIGKDSVTAQQGSSAISLRTELLAGYNKKYSIDGIKLSEPVWKDFWISVKGPDHPLLPHRIVKRDYTGKRVLYDASDPEFDDTGLSGTYTYPTNPNFRDGIFDITRFTVYTGDDHTYFKMKFRNLHNPGYHPHYGFQLTYAAILIDRDTDEPGLRDAGAHSLYTIDPELGNFDRAIYVGGGFRIIDGTGKVLCEYLPAPEDVVNPLGDAHTGTIAFAVPNEFIGSPSERWSFLMLVGAQDDHGGAGIGVFRNVERNAGEWYGGGKLQPGDPNVYDLILPQNQ
jgi:hypothetical protein